MVSKSSGLSVGKVSNHVSDSKNYEDVYERKPRFKGMKKAETQNNSKMSETYKTKNKRKDSEESIEQLVRPQNITMAPVINSRPKLSNRPSQIVIVSTNSNFTTAEHFIIDDINDMN